MNDIDKLPETIQKPLKALKQLSDGIYQSPYIAATLRGIYEDLVREILGINENQTFPAGTGDY